MSVTLIFPAKSFFFPIIFNGMPMGAPVTGGLNLLLGFWAIGFDYPVARKLLGGQRGVHWTHIFDHMMCLLVVLRVRVGCAHSCAEWLLGFRNMETICSYVYLINQNFACLVALSTSTSWLRDAQGCFHVPHVSLSFTMFRCPLLLGVV